MALIGSNWSHQKTTVKSYNEIVFFWNAVQGTYNERLRNSRVIPTGSRKRWRRSFSQICFKTLCFSGRKLYIQGVQKILPYFFYIVICRLNKYLCLKCIINILKKSLYEDAKSLNGCTNNKFFSPT